MTTVLERFSGAETHADVTDAPKERRKKCGRPRGGVKVEGGVMALAYWKTTQQEMNFQRKMATKLNVAGRHVKKALEDKPKAKTLLRAVANKNRHKTRAVRDQVAKTIVGILESEGLLVDSILLRTRSRSPPGRAVVRKCDARSRSRKGGLRVRLGRFVGAVFPLAQ